MKPVNVSLHCVLSSFFDLHVLLNACQRFFIDHGCTLVMESNVFVPELRNSYSPNNQEFGLRIGSPMFKARSPLTHLIIVQTTHQSKIRAPTAKWSVRSPAKKHRSPIQNVVI